MSPSNISDFHFWCKKEMRQFFFLLCPFIHHINKQVFAFAQATLLCLVFTIERVFFWHEEHIEGYKIYRCLYKRYLSPTQGTIRRYNRHKIWVKPHSETSYGFLAPGPQYRLDHNWNIIYQFTKQISSITILLNQYMVNYGRDISFCMISIKLLKFYYIGKS